MIPQTEIIYLHDKVPKNQQGAPIVYYGDNADDPIIVMTYSDEQELSWWKKILTGRRYCYTLTITDE